MAEPQPPARKENVLTRKIGPLPTWGWIVIAAALVIGIAWLKTRQGSKSSSGGTGTGSGQVPQFVNQTYTTVQPPSSAPPDDDDDKHRRHHRGKRHTRGDDDDRAGPHNPQGPVESPLKGPSFPYPQYPVPRAG